MMRTRNLTLQILLIGTALLTACQSGDQKITQSYSGQLQLFPLKYVKLTDSPFKAAQLTDQAYILELDPERLLAPFRIDAGIDPGAERYGNWENTGLDGHIGGHYLSALALMYASTGNEALLDRLNYMVSAIGECQEKNSNGYVGGIPGGQKIWEEIKNGQIDAGGFSLNKKWVPLYNIHKLYAGLRDAYLIAGNEQAKTILINLTDWMLDVTADLSNEQIQRMLRSEHGGLNETFADVFAITGDKKYLTLAEKFSHRHILDPLLESRDELTGQHANTQIPKVIGFQRIAQLANKSDWTRASDYFWRTIVDNRTVSIGGNSVREHFHPADDFSTMMSSNQGPETCNTYNMLRLAELLFLSKPDATYTDYYERAVYNHILSSQHPDGGFVYFTPMRPRHYRVYSQVHQGFWCCVGSGLENHGRYGEMIYAKAENELFVNLFIPSELTWEDQGVKLIQETSFPKEGKASFRFEMDSIARFGLNIRYPGWVQNGALKLWVNGDRMDVRNAPSSYFRIEKTWQSGDKVELEIPLKVSLEQLPDSSGWTSIMRGPIVMAATTDTTDIVGLFADDKRMSHVANGPMYPIDEAPMIIANDDEEILNAITETENGNLALAGVLSPERYERLDLVPFYQVHETRYMIYWQVLSKENHAKRLAELKKQEEEALQLEAQTVDQIAPGEQQPESDHNFRGERTNSGINGERFWRDAAGWFSYDLNNPNKEGKVLRITYFSGDHSRNFRILLNGKLFQSVSLKRSEQPFYEIDYPISSEFLETNKNGKMNLRFEAEKGSVAGGIYYIRLLKE